MAAGATYTPIATTTLGSAQSSVTFNSFSGYTDLILIANAQRGLSGSGESGMQITVNGDGNSNYSATLLYETGPASTRLSGQTNFQYASGAAGDGATLFNAIHFMNYSNTNTYKTVLARYGYASGNTQVRLAAGLWRSTAAITSFTLTPANNFAAGSNFTLYGILAA